MGGAPAANDDHTSSETTHEGPIIEEADDQPSSSDNNDQHNDTDLKIKNKAKELLQKPKIINDPELFQVVKDVSEHGMSAVNNLMSNIGTMSPTLMPKLMNLYQELKS